MSISAPAAIEAIVKHIASGTNIAVRRTAGEGRVIVVTSARGDAVDAIEIAAADYEPVMQQVIARLSQRRRHLRIDVRHDFYGNHWAEVRSGMFGRRLSRLAIAPRHLTALASSAAGGRNDEARQPQRGPPG